MAQDHPKLRQIVPQYIIYLGLFIGTGFLSGSIVHFPLNKSRFLLIGLVGAAIFVASSTLNELKILKREATGEELAKLIVFSVLLALGVGMISGGVQHFDEVPIYASKLIPLGIILSLLGYVLKNGITLHRTQTLKLAVLAVGFVTVLGAGLMTYATSLPTVPGHDAPTETAQPAPSPTQPPEAPQEPAPTKNRPTRSDYEAQPHGH